MISFAAWLAQRHSPATCAAYTYKISALLAHLGGSPVTHLAVTAWLDTLQQRGIRPRTLTVHLAAIRNYAAYLTDTTGAGIPGLETLKRPRLAAAGRPVPDTASVRALLAAVETLPEARPPDLCTRDRARTVLYLLAYTGIRRAELLALNVSDIQQAHAWRLHVRQGKGAVSRWVPVCPPLREVLARWLVVREERCGKQQHQSDALFPARGGSRLSPAGLEDVWARCVEVAGCGDRGWTPHSLRHWFASQIAASHGAKVAQVLLGHSSVTTTHGYLHADEAALLEAVAHLGPALAPAPAESRVESGPARPRNRKRPHPASLPASSRRPRTLSLPVRSGRRLRITLEIL